MIELKTPKEIEAMKPAGRFVGGILRDLKEFTKVGTNLLEIDEFVHIIQAKFSDNKIT